MSLPSSLHEVPFFKLLIPLVLGIVLQNLYGLLPSNVLFIAFLPVLVIVMLLANFLAKRWSLRWIYGILLNLTIFVFGLMLSANYNFSQIIKPQQSTDVLVKIADRPQERIKSYRIEADIIASSIGGFFQTESEKILLYFSIADSLVESLNYADVLALRVEPQEFEQPTNPYQFNFEQYMRRKGIRYSSFVQAGEWQLVDNRANPIIRLAREVREKLLALFAQSGLSRDELAVVSALTVGYKNLLDDELYRIYSAAGATHILAVSGLHVGIIYGMLVLLFSLIPRLNKKLKMAFSILFLWFFAFVTGLSPSVMRATAMFTMFEFGRSFGYRTNSYNTLAAVAFILLVIEPNNLFNLGFQLSFLAVLSIVFFNPYISHLFYFKNRILSWVWDLLAVSVSAQIGTLPIILLNFGQFSNYFLLTNMLAIPMASIILYMAVLLIAVSSIPAISVVVSKILGFSVSFLNSGLRWIEHLPNSVSNGLYCSVLQSVILVAAILFLAGFLERKRALALHAMLVCLCAYLLIQHQRIISNRSDELVVFNLPRKSALCLNQNLQATFFDTDTAAVDILNSYSFYLSGYVENMASAHRSASFNLARFKPQNTNTSGFYLRRKNGMAIIGVDNCLIAFPYNDSIRFGHTSSPLNVDLLVVNRFVDESVVNIVKPKVAVFDSSVWADRFPKLAVYMLSKGIKVHDLQSHGAYRHRL